ncbi:MAG: zinc-dependent metalloprotease family protein [Chloroflexota bacterium]
MNPTPSSDRSNMTLWLLFGAAGLAFLFILLLGSQQPPATAAPSGAQSADSLWQDVNEALLRPAGERRIVPEVYRTVALNWEALNSLLVNVPDSAAARSSEVVLSLPLPNGAYGRFQLYETAVMHPDLAAKFPEIRTYAGIGLDDPTATARVDTTPHGFHAMILSANGRVFIDPLTTASTDLYQSYYASDFIPNLPADFEPDVVIEPEGANEPARPAAVSASSGGTLRTYRLAVAATGEYTIYHGGTVELAMAEIVTAVNRVTGIYEREVAIRLQLIGNNDAIIYTNGSTDPYTNDNGFTMLDENQAVLDSVIGTANYDIGHVFSTGGGGVAVRPSVCSATYKAQGVTGRPAPIGDPFYVDYVAHEMGHQFAGNHTFNTLAGSCGGNRAASAAYEPGSASTIMGYAGICAPDNLQGNSDDYFHAISFDEIVNYTTVGNGNNCGSQTATGNTPPSVEAGASYSIPLNTPFTLTGSATDPADAGSLTYNWEQFDLGPAGFALLPPTSGDAPIFRSFPATSSPSRTFPKISDIVNNTQTIGERLPTYARTMNFRLTVRDNQATGGVAYDATTVTAVANTGPFLVTAPNTAVTWTGNTLQNVTWNVANTTAAPISCANVNIQLSSDGGYTYPTVLEMNTPNDGSQTIFVPNLVTNSARVRVSCANNIFFDISNANFTIQLGVGGDPSLTVSKSVAPSGPVAPGDSLTYTIDVDNVGTAPAASTTITDTFATALTSPVCNGVPGNLVDTVTINPTQGVQYVCTAVVDPTLALAVEITANPAVISSTETTTYTVSITNSHGSLSLSNVQVSAPGITGCTPALTTPQTLGPGANQIYTCPNNLVGSPGAKTATATGQLTISNTAYANDPDDTGLKSSSPVNTQVTVTGSDSVMIVFSDYYYLYLPLITK